MFASVMLDLVFRHFWLRRTSLKYPIMVA